MPELDAFGFLGRLRDGHVTVPRDVSRRLREIAEPWPGRAWRIRPLRG